MTEIYGDPNGTMEEKRRFVANFNLMDDTFFAVVMENKAACEYLLTALLGRPIRFIRSNKTQYSIKNAENHSIVLDALIEDENKTKYNIEIQVSDQGNFKRRVRFYRSAIDWASLKKNEDYSKLPDVYMIFISSFDPFKENKNRYEVKKYLDSGSEYDDGEHILYFNTQVDDGSELSKLLQYLAHSSADNVSFGALSQAVRYNKVNDEGVEFMCKIVDEYGERKKQEGSDKSRFEMIENLVEQGVSLEVSLKAAKIDLREFEILKRKFGTSEDRG